MLYLSLFNYYFIQIKLIINKFGKNIIMISFSNVKKNTFI